MAYPRCCPRCGADYGSSGGAELRHVTMCAEPGGTPSPWRRALAGRLLTLRCLVCRGEYRWDYFADARTPAASPAWPPGWEAVRTRPAAQESPR